MTLFVYAPDLMDRSKLTAAAPAAVVVVRLDQLEAGAGDTVVLDLSRPGAMESVAPLASKGARVVGFASHVDRERIEAAQGAGCEVFARSAFFSRLSELLG
jgi:hypothetical protein